MTTTAITLPRYTAPDITVTTPTGLPPRPVSPAELSSAGHYQRLTLDVRTGELTMAAADWRLPRSQRPHYSDPDIQLYLPGERPWEIPHAGPVISWTIESGRSDTRPLTPTQGASLARSAAEAAADLLSALYAPDPADPVQLPYWSAGARTAAARIDRITRLRDETWWAASKAEPEADTRDHHVDAEYLFARAPELIEPAWADRTDADMAETADAIARLTVTHHPDAVRAALGRADDIRLWGVLPWLYAYRRAAHTDRTPAGADTYTAARPEVSRELISRVPATASDEQMTAAAEWLTATAADDGFALTGTRTYLDRLRADHRRHVEERLASEGEEVARLEAALKDARARRRASLAQVLTWTCKTDSDLGKLAGMSKQAISQLRAALAADDTE